MEKYKAFFRKNKKAVTAAIIAVVILAVGIAGCCVAGSARGEDSGTGQAPAQQQETNPVTVMKEETAKEALETDSTDSRFPSATTAGSVYTEPATADGDTDSSLPPSSSSQHVEIPENSTRSGGGTTSVHQHEWVNHTIQVWVPKIVTIVDQPEQTVFGARFYTMNNSGDYVANGPTYWFENGFTQDDLKSLIKEGLMNADENGLYNGVYYGNYQNVTKTIPAVTHQEDQGHYENNVDFQYCSSCGQRK